MECLSLGNLRPSGASARLCAYSCSTHSSSLRRLTLWILDAVLSQRAADKMHPLAFFAHQLSPTKHNYNMGRWELLVVKLALEEWRHLQRKLKIPLLFGWPQEMICTHCKPGGLFLVAQFNYTNFYLPDSWSTNADALSPQREWTNPPSLPRRWITWKIESLVSAAQQNEIDPQAERVQWSVIISVIHTEWQPWLVLMRSWW